MKKFLPMLLVLLLCCCIPIEMLSSDKNDEYTIYLKNKVLICNTTAIIINNGSGLIVVGNKQQTEPLLKGDNVSGYSFKTSQMDINNYVKQLSIILHSSETLDKISCFYGYTPLITNYIIIDGKKTNIQIAVNNGVTTVGTPIILGSY